MGETPWFSVGPIRIEIYCRVHFYVEVISSHRAQKQACGQGIESRLCWAENAQIQIES
jgi:hypothetical protein